MANKKRALILGDSMLSGIYGRRITQNNNIKVLPRSDYAKYVGLSKSTLKKNHLDSIVSHIRTNSTPNEPSRKVLDRILLVKRFT